MKKTSATDWRDHLFVHEYGHYIQSQRMGPLFLRVVGAPSLFSAALMQHLTGIDHENRWFEVDASYLGARHFNRKYGGGAEGYIKGDENFFNQESFINGSSSKYLNPRTGKTNENANPISNATISFWDFSIL